MAQGLVGEGDVVFGALEALESHWLDLGEEERHHVQRLAARQLAEGLGDGEVRAEVGGLFEVEVRLGFGVAHSLGPETVVAPPQQPHGLGVRHGRGRQVAQDANGLRNGGRSGLCVGAMQLEELGRAGVELGEEGRGDVSEEERESSGEGSGSRGSVSVEGGRRGLVHDERSDYN